MQVVLVGCCCCYSNAALCTSSRRGHQTLSAARSRVLHSELLGAHVQPLLNENRFERHAALYCSLVVAMYCTALCSYVRRAQCSCSLFTLLESSPTPASRAYNPSRRVASDECNEQQLTEVYCTVVYSYCSQCTVQYCTTVLLYSISTHRSVR